MKCELKFFKNLEMYPITRSPTNFPSRKFATLPPDGGYGWVCVACCFTINAFTWGVLSVSPLLLAFPFSIYPKLTFQSYGVYLSYYLQNNVFPSANTTDFALIGGLNFSMAMIISPLATFLTRTYGVHVPMALGIFSQTSGFIAASFASQIWQLYLTKASLGRIRHRPHLDTKHRCPTTVVLKRRSMANGICSAGSGIGGIIFSFAVRAIMSNYSLAWALRTCGLVSGFMNILATCAIRSSKIISCNHGCIPSMCDFSGVMRLFWHWHGDS